MNKAEKKQKVDEEYNQICNDMTKAGYEKKVHIFSKTKTTVWGIIIPLILTIIIGVLYRMVNGTNPDFELNYPLFLAIALTSIVVHELIHGFAWAIGCKEGLKSISLSLNGIMPFCHCKEVLDRDKYLLGVLMPFLLLAVVIIVIAFILSNIWLILSGIINLFLAGGDLLIAFSLIGCKNQKIVDHPTAPGFVAFINN